MLVLSNVHLVPGLSRLVVSEAGNMHAGATVAAPKVVIMGSSVHLPDLETAAERNSNIRIFRMRTLSQGEITGGGHDFLERLRLLDFPSVVSYNESNRDLILSQAMRGGYPSERDGTPDERHDFFHDLIREICRLDLPVVSPLKNPLLLRKVYRMVGGGGVGRKCQSHAHSRGASYRTPLCQALSGNAGAPLPGGPRSGLAGHSYV